MAKLSISLRSTSVNEAIEKIAYIKEAHPEDVLKIDVTILDDYLLNSSQFHRIACRIVQ